MTVKDCDTESSYRYKNVTVCECCRRNGPNEYLKSNRSSGGLDASMQSSGSLSSCALMSVLPRPQSLFMLVYFAPRLSSRPHVRAQPPHHLRL